MLSEKADGKMSKNGCGYMEVFGSDQDGGERSFEVYYAIQQDGSIKIEGYPGIEECIYFEASDIEQQIRDELA